jgi:transposase-like protein
MAFFRKAVDSQYLNNIVEHDHRAIKGRCRPMLSFKSYRTHCSGDSGGIELASHAQAPIQVRAWSVDRWICWSLKKQWDTALA